MTTIQLRRAEPDRATSEFPATRIGVGDLGPPIVQQLIQNTTWPITFAVPAPAPVPALDRGPVRVPAPIVEISPDSNGGDQELAAQRRT